MVCEDILALEHDCVSMLSSETILSPALMLLIN